jgi:nucleotide-binding universal stress UspA family protein
MSEGDRMIQILFATDGSEHAANAGRMLEEWPLAGRAHVTVVTVVPPLHLFSPSLVVPTSAGWGEMPLLLQDEARKAEQIAQRAAARLRERGVLVDWMVSHGPPPVQLLAAAEALNPDLVVLGAHGQAGLMQLQIGSVALNVARLAPCSTLVVRGTAPWSGRVLLATDGSPESERAIRLLASLPLPEKMECTVLHVLEPVSPASGGELASRREAANAIGEAAAATLTTAGFQATPRVIEGLPAQEILRHVRDTAPDLIIVGARGTSGMSEFEVGSVSTRMLRYAPCSVIVAR